MVIDLKPNTKKLVINKFYNHVKKYTKDVFYFEPKCVNWADRVQSHTSGQKQKLSPTQQKTCGRCARHAVVLQQLKTRGEGHYLSHYFSCLRSVYITTQLNSKVHFSVGLAGTG